MPVALPLPSQPVPRDSPRRSHARYRRDAPSTDSAKPRRGMDRKMSEQKLNIEFVKEVEKYPCIYDYRRPDYARKEVIDIAWATIGKKINLSGPQCRERWKNLRTVLSRNLRPSKDTNGRPRSLKQQRKPYYLFDTMKFAVPFIKSQKSVPIYLIPKDSSNSTSEQEATHDDERLNEEADEDEDVKESICHIKVEVPEYSISRSPSPQNSTPPLSPQVNISETHSPTTPTSPPQSESKTIIRKRKKSDDTAEIEEDEDIMTENFKRKKIENENKIKPDLTKISKKRFLLSLLPDVYSMDNTQMRSFRIKILNLINEITQKPSTTSGETPCSVCQHNAAKTSQVPEPPSQSKNLTIKHNSVFSPKVAVKIEKKD